MSPTAVFLVEDDEAVRKGCEQALSLADIRVRTFANAEHMMKALATEIPALVVTDVRLPGMDGLTLMRELRQTDRDMPVVLMTGHGDVTMAVDAMRDGAWDFIEKPFASERLVTTVQRALQTRRLELENRQLKSRLRHHGVANIIGQTAPVQRLRHWVETLAPTGVDILINGETGAGKEVVARAIHDASGRTGPFVAINCGALPESIVESELFGHESGAFTGASKRRIGRIEHASGGTLFLDEIETMPLSLQVRFLRVLQERSIERLGSNTPVPLDLRLVAASKVDLKQAADAGRFRSDLYYRLNVVSVDLPPLRERREDIAPLMAHFLAEAAQRYQRPVAVWNPTDLARWQQHDWPGNVRELKNVADRWALGLPDGLTMHPQASTAGASSLTEQLDAVERALLTDALKRNAGNVVLAAQMLQTPRKTFYDKLSRHGIVPDDFRR